MRVLVATKKCQGVRDNDFSHARAGDRVKRGLVCDADERNGPDGGCGCNRCLVGMGSSKGTTTVLVVEQPGASRAELLAELRKSERRDGWISANPPTNVLAALEREADWLIAAAAKYPAGTVLEYRAGAFRVRAKPARPGKSGGAARARGVVSAPRRCVATGAGHPGASDFLPRSAPGDVLRADGSCRCRHCGRAYREHPHDPYEIAWHGGAFLRVLCDGTRVKL